MAITVGAMVVFSLVSVALDGLVRVALDGHKEAATATPSSRRLAPAPEERAPSEPEDFSSTMDGRIPEPAASASTNDTTAPSVEAPVILVPLDAQMQGPTAAPAPEEPKEVLKYRILEVEDLSSGGVVRLQYRIRVSRQPTEQELRAVCNRTIEREKKRRHNAISFLFYLPDSDPHGFFTAGKAHWAPNGIWEDASKVAAGHYSRHRLVVECGNALSEISAKPSKPSYDFKPDRPVPETPSWEELLSPRRPPSKPSYTVKYIVSFGPLFRPACGGDAFVTYENDQGGTEQAEVRVDSLRAGAWEKTLFSVKRGGFLYLSAQNQGRGDIRATILVDGHVWKTSGSSGAYAIASCSGLIGLE
ncbi:MAG: hypothetical protein Q8Q12_05680 [bacterium]|nr:hypothetical protein [bacterium]